MEPEVSLPRSQQPATCPCPEQDQSSPHPLLPLFKVHFILSYHLQLGLPRGILPLGFVTKILDAYLPHMQLMSRLYHAP